MNYLAEILAFERWLETNYLPIPSQLLWYKLIGLFNGSGWAEWIQVDNQRLMAKMQMKREATFVDHRDKLIEAGLISYQKGKKGYPNKYKLISVCTTDLKVQTEVQTEVKSVVKSVVKPVVKPVVNTEVQTVDIYKQNKNKTKQKNVSNDTLEKIVYYPDEKLNQTVYDFIQYRKSIKKPLTDKAIDLLIKKLNGMTSSNDERIAILEQSILSNWQGIFPLKDIFVKSGTKQTMNDLADVGKEWLNDRTGVFDDFGGN